MRLAFALSAVLFAISAQGCAEPSPAPAKPNLHLSRASDAERQFPVIAVRKIVNAESGKLVGYLKVREDFSRKRPVIVSWVHDDYFQVRGFYTEDGMTFRRARGGDVEDLGQYPVIEARRVLLGLPGGTALELRPMDQPRTLESDAEAAAEAKAKATAAAKKDAGDAKKDAGEKP